MSTDNNKYDALIQAEVKAHFPELLHDLGPDAWLWIKAQVWAESEFNPNAVSNCGALGLMQLMPATDRAIDGDLDGKDAAGNVDNGVRFMADLYRAFREIPDCVEKLRFAQASYNGGKGYVNVALALARQSECLPYSYGDWKAQGQKPGNWQRWVFASNFLADSRCVVKGRHPVHKQMTDYVKKIGGKVAEFRVR